LSVARLSAELRAPSRIYDNMIEISGLRGAIVAAAQIANRIFAAIRLQKR
jgi:hypothetical protein